MEKFEELAVWNGSGRCEIFAQDRVRRLIKIAGESDTYFVRRAQMIYQTGSKQVSEKEGVAILMGKSSHG